MARDRQNVFTRHPEGMKILEQLINKEIKQVDAARKLGCTSANISIYLRDHNLRPTREERKPQHEPTTAENLVEQLAAMEEFSVPIDGKTPSNLTAAAGWQTTLKKGLAMMIAGNLDADGFVKLANVLMRMMQFSFKYPVPDIPQELVKIDEETEARLIKALGAFCDQCPYLKAFNARKAIEQSKFRLEPEQSASVG